MIHDARFKLLLKTPTVLQGFFDAFLPQAARFVDFACIEFLDKERFTFDRRRRTGDLLVKTRFRGQDAGFLIHLEHQAQHDPGLGRRMLEYFLLDWRDFDLPVYPVAVLSHKERLPAPLSPVTVSFPNRQVLDFRFDVIDLARLDARTYVSTPNLAAMALSCRMSIPRERRQEIVREFTVSLARLKPPRRVADTVAGFFFAYHRLTPKEALQLRQQIGKVETTKMRKEIVRFTNPWIEAGKQQGLRRGLRRGRRQEALELVLKQLARRIGSISAGEEKSVRMLPLAKIEEVGVALLGFQTRGDLARWLKENAS